MSFINRLSSSGRGGRHPEDRYGRCDLPEGAPHGDKSAVEKRGAWRPARPSDRPACMMIGPSAAANTSLPCSGRPPNRNPASSRSTTLSRRGWPIWTIRRSTSASPASRSSAIRRGPTPSGRRRYWTTPGHNAISPANDRRFRRPRAPGYPGDWRAQKRTKMAEGMGLPSNLLCPLTR